MFIYFSMHVRLFLFVSLLFLPCFKCYSQSKSQYIIEPSEFNSKLNSVELAHLFDIRVEKQFKQKRIKSSVLADTKEKFQIYLQGLDKNDTIFVYCEIGKRTIQCAKWLNSIGYTNVYLLKGGITNWEKQGFPIDKSKIDK